MLSYDRSSASKPTPQNMDKWITSNYKDMVMKPQQTQSTRKSGTCPSPTIMTKVVFITNMSGSKRKFFSILQFPERNCAIPFFITTFLLNFVCCNWCVKRDDLSYYQQRHISTCVKLPLLYTWYPNWKYIMYLEIDSNFVIVCMQRSVSSRVFLQTYNNLYVNSSRLNCSLGPTS